MLERKSGEQIVLGFDFGLKRIGVAVGQTLTETASPLKTLKALNGEPNWEELTKLVQQWRPNLLVVGVPVNMDDSPQALTAIARQFAHALKQHLGLPVVEIDERLTTKEARQRLFEIGGYRAIEKSEVDSYAAKLILESWLQRKVKPDDTK